MNDDNIINEKIMIETCKLALAGIENGFGPFACIITDKFGNIIGKGNNMVTLHNDPTQHAEIVAIRDACKNLNNFNLTDTIIYTSCEPCPMCLSAIYWSHISKVYYGNTRTDAKDIGFDDSFIYDEVSKHINDRQIPMVQLCRENSIQSFRAWDNKLGKIKY